ncbi:NAD-dependent epimerase/dehydratase family protein [Celeribacter sp. ULVN23_4]
MTDTVLLTGVTGFLGGHLALDLLNSGYHVRGSLRNPARADKTRAALARAGADTSRLSFVQLDLMDDSGWAEAAKGARFMIHSASPFVTTMPKDPQELIRPAVAGTERALRAALGAGLERVVLTSSIITMNYGLNKDRPNFITEGQWSNPEGGRLTAYGQSKVYAERRAWEIAKAETLSLATVQPGFITGPLIDDDPGVSGAVLLRMLKGGFPMSPNLHLNIADARDLARIHVAALTAPGSDGKRHPAGFDPMSIREIAETVARAHPELRSKLPLRNAPDWLVRVMGLFDGDIRANLNELSYRPRFDTIRAEALMGRKAIASPQSILDMSQSLIERGLVASAGTRAAA